MPSPTCTETPGPSNASQSSKRAMSDAESAPQDAKKPRWNSSTEPSARRGSNRDPRRRKKKKKKSPVVATNNEYSRVQLGERLRAPLSARNQVIRFTSDPPEADQPPSAVPSGSYSSQMPSMHGALVGSTEHRDAAMSSTLKDERRADGPLPERSCDSLENKVAQLEAELESKNKLVASHQALLSQVQQAITCQVCLDLMYKPYALAPCGHVVCYSCLVNWFTAPPPDNRPAPPALVRKKTCPHCRAVVRVRPVEIWGMKGISRAVGKSGLLANQLPVPVDGPESVDANTDPWKDIFAKSDAVRRRGFPWFLPVDDDDIDIADVAPRGEDVGMLDMEDGGIYRCLDCMHEIWDGVCTSCGRVYPGHRSEEDEDDEVGDAVGWLDDQLEAEEVDMADDPSWMGLEDGEADDGGEIDDWRRFAWQHTFDVPMLRGAVGFLGAIRVDEEDDEEEGVEEDSEDDEYEGSFIDDGDDGAHIRELDEEEEEEEDSYQPRIVELDEEHDEESNEDIYRGRRRRVVESDDDVF